MGKHLTLLLGLLVLVWAGTTATAAGVYRWVDEQGRVHYSDVPVTGAQSINLHTFEPEDGGKRPAGPRTLASPPGQAEERLDEGPGKELALTEVEKCQLAEQQLAVFRNSDVVIERDAYGEQRTLSDEERARGLAAAGANVEKYCG